MNKYSVFVESFLATLELIAARGRARVLRLRGADVGAKVKLGEGCSFSMPWGITIGRRAEIEPNVVFKITARDAEIQVGASVFIGRGTILDINSRLEIGPGVLVAPGCFITDHNHGLEGRTPVGKQDCASAPVVIERDVWLGAQVTVLPGVRIGEGAVIGAGSVVTKNIPSFVIAAGIPAKVIRSRNQDGTGEVGK